MPRDAKYRQIASDLRAAISNGEYDEAGQLPAVADLQQRYGVSLMTVHQALSSLESEGRIIRHAGKRATVREYRPKVRDGIRRLGPATWPAGRDIWEADADGRPYYARDVRVRRGAPTDTAAEILDLGDGEETVIRSRVYYLDDRPVLISMSYIPADLAEGTAIERENSGPGGTYARLADAGSGPVRFREDLRARMPDGHEAGVLELPAGTAVVDITRTAWRADGRAVEVNFMIAGADSHIFRYEWSTQTALAS